jgi:hypothetical protein
MDSPFNLENKMTEVKKAKSTKYIALKKLFTEKDGLVKKGDECTCTAKEASAHKKTKAI